MPAKDISLYKIIERSSFLKRVPLFADLKPKYLASIARLIDEVHLLKGEVLFEFGEPGDYMYLIRQGSISIRIHGDEVAVLGEQECLGEMALSDGLPRSASAVILSEATLMRISSIDFRKLLETKPEISMALMRTIANHLREADAH